METEQIKEYTKEILAKKRAAVKEINSIIEKLQNETGLTVDEIRVYQNKIIDFGETVSAYVFGGVSLGTRFD